ncbi:SpoIIE family protein phosphatase [Streptomyces sp. NPDC048179]|uniref:ATP-binding SpoIIE family protein phosphatase n=1 Tax=Streptomyces sp. NPDC048179 TaxID=3365506 RepID=UPI00371B8041
MLHLPDSESGLLRLAAADGLSRQSTAAWAVMDEDQETSPLHALRRGTITWAVDDSHGMTAVPVSSDAHGPIGVLTVLTTSPDEPDDLQRSLLHTLAAWVGACLNGVPDTAPDAVAGRKRTVRIEDLTAALAEALTSRDVVRAVAEHVLPPFGADGLLFDVFVDGRPHVVHSIGYPEELPRALNALPLSDNAVALDLITTRTPRFIESPEDFARIYPTMTGILTVSPMNAWAFLPMIASGHGVGLCAVSFREPRSFSAEERTLLTALSSLVGQALERARLYDTEHDRSQELQHGLLPRELPRLPAACAAARYLPAGRGEEVGGDWYDLIPLSADRVAMVIGDVMGHGISEAVTMARLRTAVRTLADLDMPPDELLGHLNDLVSDLGEDFYATCLYAVFDPVGRTFTYSVAGHPPPVIMHPDGSVHCPEGLPDPPLGAAEPPFDTRELHLPNESLLVLCTDGLIESATRDADQGLAQLRRALAGSRHLQGDTDDVEGLEELCDLVTSTLLPAPERTTDDAALLIARIRATAADDVATRLLPDHPQAAGLARDFARKQLAAWGLDDLVMTTELLVSELIGNVVRHAKGPVRLRLLRSRSLICEVYDGSLSTPRIRHTSYTDEGGRGLQLVAALSRRWGARYLHDGKCIWTEQDMPRPAT